MDNQNNNESGKIEKNPVQANPRRNKLARALLIWAGILFLQAAFFALFNWKPYCDTEGLPAIILMAAIVIGMVALFIIKKRLAWIALITIVLISAFEILRPHLHGHGELAVNVICMVHLRGFYTAAAIYSQENEGRLPEAGKWGRAVADKDIPYKMFFCPEDKRERADEISLSSYAMNVEAGGKKLSELPEDMVLFFCAEIEESKRRQFEQEKQEEVFEAKDRYPRDNNNILALYGGPELVSFRHMTHGNVAEVMCVSVSGYTYRDNPTKLRWYIDPTKEIPQDVRDKMNETYRTHLARIKMQQLKIRCWIAGWLVGPYVLWLVVFIALKRRKHSTNS